MSNRKSFLIHIDSLDVLDDLNDEQCGQLFKAIKAFQLGEDIALSSLVKIAFSPFKNQFIRDDEKYKKTCEARALAGSKGGKQKVANASKCNQKVANLADSDNKNKSDSDNKTKKDKKVKSIPYDDILNAYHETLTDHPKVRIYSDGKKRKVKGLYNYDKRHSDIDWWKSYFEHVKLSMFLTGQVPSRDDRKPWKADFEWLMNKENFAKIVDGKYHNE